MEHTSIDQVKPKKLELYPIKTPVIREGDDLVDIILESIDSAGLSLEDGDIIAIADKVVAISDGRVIDYREISPSPEALDLAEKYGLEPGFVELVLREADLILGGTYRALSTIKEGIFIANAGIDHKNVPEGHASLWPANPDERARELRLEIERRTGRKIGVILVDSRVTPLRRGTTGVAIGSSGIRPVVDLRGKRDLFGKSLKITFVNLIDDLASAAHLVMGETDESTPAVVIKNAPVEVGDLHKDLDEKISPDECMYMSNLTQSIIYGKPNRERGGR